MDKENIKQILTKEIPVNQIYVDEPMKKHTTFKIGGNADILVKVKQLKELEYIIKIAKQNDINITIIGNGSNLLVKDNGIRGIVVKVEIDDILINGETVTVGAGVKLGQLAQVLLKESLTGFEFASGIPGTIGGAVRMNAGAYGSEMKDIVVETKGIKLSENITTNKEENVSSKQDINNNLYQTITLTNEEQEFSYRHSIFMEKNYIIIGTTLKLEKGNKEEIKSKMDEFLKSRKEKQPVNMPSAGSTFKRGNDFITAKLIDECGLKGYSIGDAQVSDLHAGFIVNKGNATFENVKNLIQYVQKTVYEKTGKKIELEIEIIGE